MRVLCVWGKHNYGDPARGKSYEYTNFAPALQALGHEVLLFDSWDRSLHADFAALNRALLERVCDARPDLVFCVLLGYEVWLETLDSIRHQLGTPVLNWGTDDSWKHRSFSRYVARHVDLYATTSAQACEQMRSSGLHNIMLSQWAASSLALREPMPAENCSLQVSFVGSAYGHRPRWIEQLRDRGIAVECFGYGWPRGPIGTAQIVEICQQSVISLNFSESSTGGGRQVKARVFEISGAGGFLVTQSAPELQRCYRIEEEAVTFDGVDELAEKIRFYLGHPDLRDRIARAGHMRTVLEHTYEQRFAPLLESVRPSMRRSRDVAAALQRFGRAETGHRVPAELKLLRALLVGICTPIWGRRRGARAARRMLFEVSWRVFGAATYSARGLPGRLFYRES